MPRRVDRNDNKAMQRRIDRLAGREKTRLGSVHPPQPTEPPRKPDPKPEKPPKLVPMTAMADGAKVLKLESNWHTVTAGRYIVSVAPDGTVTLPRHITPDQVDDFLTALSAAANVGMKLVAESTADAVPESPVYPAFPVPDALPQAPRGFTTQALSAARARREQQQ